jgi:YegS/Rv2252/BmrU family lipid kinase
MTAQVVLNPYSNRWNAQARWPQAEAALRSAGIDFQLAVSQGPGEAAELAEAAAREGRFPVIAAGGDGTIGEVVNGLAKVQGEASWGPLGILPLGSANDLAYSLGLPTDLDAAAVVVATGNVRLMDIGRANDTYFANNSAVGLEPYVTTVQQRIRRIKGVLRYLVAALGGIWQRPSWSGKLEWADGSYQGPLTLLTVGIGCRSGGVFYMIPHADPFDGELTFVYGHRGSRWGMLRLLPKAMRPGAGSYVEAEGMHELSSSWLRVHLDQGSPGHTDGELWPGQVTDIEYQVLPAKLQILVPGRS